MPARRPGDRHPARLPAARCNQVAAKGYEGFVISNGDAVMRASHSFTSHPPMPDIPAPLLPIIVERLTAAGLMPAA